MPTEKIQDFFFERVINSFQTVTGLLSAYAISILIFAPLHMAIGDDFNFEYVAYVAWFVALTCYWFFYRYRLPRNRKKMVGVVVALVAKDQDSRKLKKQFVEELRKKFRSSDLQDVFNVISLPDRHAVQITDEQSIKKQNLKIKAHLYLYGEVIKERDGDHDRYFINLDGRVSHLPVPIAVSNELSFDFRQLLPKEFSLSELFGFRCIKATSRIAYLTARYVVGVAAFLSGDPFLAYRLHRDLEIELEAYNDINSEFERTEAEVSKIDLKYIRVLLLKLRVLISNEAVIIARIYQLNNDEQRCIAHLKVALEKDPNNYSAYLLQAIVYFIYEKNTVAAMKCIKKARKLSRNLSHEWRYSEAFILFWNEKFEDAYKSCQKLILHSYLREDETVNDVETFNLNILENCDNKPQLYFWIGFLMLKKRGDMILAKKYFQSFLEKSNGNIPFLEDKTRSFLTQLE